MEKELDATAPAGPATGAPIRESLRLATDWVFQQHPNGAPYFGNITGYLGRNASGLQQIRTIAVLPKYGSPDEMIRYARLISAAPDLLNACIAAEQWLSGWASAEPYIDTIRAAINKATGAA